MSRSIERVVVPVAVVAVAVTWLASAATDVLGGDNGELATITATGGAAHPPGYPLVAMYLHAMRWLSASPAHASALANALVAVAALAVLGRACRAWGASPAATAVACALWGLAPTTWTLAASAEVFAANALFASVILWLAAPDPPLTPRARLVALGLVAGLALANHYTIVTIAPVGVCAVVGALRGSRERLRSAGIALFAFVVAGALPYAFLFVVAGRSLDPSTWSWGDVHDRATLLAYLARSDYPASAINAPGHVLDELARLTRQLLGAPVLALCVGAWALVRRPLRGPWLTLAASIVCAGPLFMSVFHTPLDGAGRAVTERFDLLPMTLLAPCVAVSLDVVLARRLAFAPAAAGALCLTGGLALAGGLPAIRARHRSGVALYARDALVTLPPRAILVGTGDARFGALLYAQYALHERPDVTFVNPRLLFAPWYYARIERALGAELPPVHDKTLDVVPLLSALLATGRPVFVSDVFSASGLAHFPSYPLGPLIRIVSDPADVPSPEAVEAENLALAPKLVHEPLPLPGPEPWSDGLALDFVRPWAALADQFARQGDPARAEANRRRADEARAYAWP